MARIQQIAATLLPLVFGLLALIFSLLAITSPQWALRHHYANNTDPTTQIRPIYTLYRSPFQICGVNGTVVNPTNATNSTGSSTSSTNSTDSSDGGDGSDDSDQPPPPQLNYTYSLICQHFHPYGRNRTSCELASVTKDITRVQAGNARLCQQIHYAGNYSLVSAAFIGASFLFTIGMAAVGLLSSSRSTTIAQPADATVSEPEDPTAGEGTLGKHTPQVFQSSSSNSPASVAYAYPPISPPLFAASPYLTLLILTFAFIGVASALLSQFFGVLAFVQSSINNADFATSTGNHEHHGPWVQGRALSTYMTLSWCFAAAAGFGVHVLWRGTAWQRL